MLGHNHQKKEIEMSESNQNQERPNVPTMVAENMGASLKQFMLQEMRIMPNVWEKMNETQQNETIDRVERRIRYMAAAAANTMASGDMVSVKGYIEGVAIKDKIKLTMIVSSMNPDESLSELYRNASGDECRLVLCNSDEYVGGMEYVEIPEPDQNQLIDEDDELLWCVVVPIRSGSQTVVPAPSHAQAEGFALKVRKLLRLHDSDLAALVYARPWDENKASHDRKLKRGYWENLQDWHKSLEAGDIKAEVAGLIEHVIEPDKSAYNAAEVAVKEETATKPAQTSDNGTDGDSKQDKAPKKERDSDEASKEEEKRQKKRDYDRARRAQKKAEGK